VPKSTITYYARISLTKGRSSACLQEERAARFSLRSLKSLRKVSLLCIGSERKIAANIYARVHLAIK
jgi:hypothetical protein